MYELYGTERRSPRPEWGVSNRRLRRMGRGWDGGGRVASYTAYFAACTFVFALFNAGWEQPMESIPTSDSGPLTTAAPTLGLPKLPKIGHTTDTQNAFKFISANYSAIHYVGRWVYSENEDCMEPMFPTSYVELFHNSTTISIELSGTIDDGYKQEDMRPVTEGRTLIYTTSVDDQDHVYQVALNVELGVTNLTTAVTRSSTGRKQTRIIFPRGSEGHHQMGLRGFYIDHDAVVGHKGEALALEFNSGVSRPTKLIEVITDAVGDFSMSPRVGGNSGLLAESMTAARSILHWAWRAGERFGVDRRIIGVDGVCLAAPCPGLKHPTWSLQDVYFRSGPPMSGRAHRPWPFAAEQRPDVIIISLGHSDSASPSAMHWMNATAVDEVFTKRFEDAYVNFVRSIRQQAYPVRFNPQSGLEDEGVADADIERIQPVVPIYLVHPFHNSKLTESVRRAAARLVRGEEEGYRGVAETKIYEVDTSAWFSTKEGDIEAWTPIPRPTFVTLNGSSSSPQEVWRLTPIGHEKAEVYLQPRICRYLAKNPVSECPDFGEHEVGQMEGGIARLRGPSPEREQRRNAEKKATEMKLRREFVW